MTTHIRSAKWASSLLLSVAVCLIANCMANHSSAAVIEYTDRAAFEAALASSTTFDFESLPPAGSADLLGSFTGDDETVPTFGDATVESTNGTGIYATDDFGAPTRQIGSQNSGGVLVSLAPGYSALGMDIGAIFGPSTFDYTLTGTSGVLLSGTLNVADNDFLGTATTTFFGYISDSESLVSLQFERNANGANDFETIDNLIYGNPVPEPASVVIVALGIVAACVRRNFA